MLRQILELYTLNPTQKIPALSHFGPRSIVTKTAWHDDPLYKRPQAHGLDAVRTKQHLKATVFFELSTVLGVGSLNEHSET